MKAILGQSLNINLIDDTISRIEINENMKQIQENYSKLAIIKINDTVGYGLIAIEDIPAKSVITYYSGVFSHQCILGGNEYSLGNEHFQINAEKNRNFAGFITHSFKKYPSSDISIQDFSPVQKDNVVIDDIQWRKSILVANLTRITKVHNHCPYIFFQNPKLILKGSILAWDYGLPFWYGRHIQPSLLTLEGEVIPPEFYVCSNSSYNKITKPIDEKMDRYQQVSLKPCIANNVSSFFSNNLYRVAGVMSGLAVIGGLYYITKDSELESGVGSCPFI